MNLCQVIDVDEGEKKGNVEKWLYEIEYVMKLTLNLIAKRALKDKSKRSERILKYPAMTVLMDDMVWW